MNWYLSVGGTLIGPGAEQRERASCGNPECLDLQSLGYIPEWIEPGESPLGYLPAVLEMRDGRQFACVYRAGTDDERAAAVLAQRRAAMVCTPRQARRVLETMGLLDAVDQYMAGRPTADRIDWEWSNEIRRDNQLLESAAELLGITATELDDLFISAMSIQ